MIIGRECLSEWFFFSQNQWTTLFGAGWFYARKDMLYAFFHPLEKTWENRKNWCRKNSLNIFKTCLLNRWWMPFCFNYFILHEKSISFSPSKDFNKTARMIIKKNCFIAFCNFLMKLFSMLFFFCHYWLCTVKFISWKAFDKIQNKSCLCKKSLLKTLSEYFEC